MSQILFGKKNPKNGQSERGYVEFRSESCYPLSLGERPFVCQTISYSVSSFQFQFRLSGVTGSARQVAFYIVLKYTLYSRLPKRIVELLFYLRKFFPLFPLFSPNKQKNSTYIPFIYQNSNFQGDFDMSIFLSVIHVALKYSDILRIFFPKTVSNLL